jgi:hypothetical protein
MSNPLLAITALSVLFVGYILGPSAFEPSPSPPWKTFTLFGVLGKPQKAVREGVANDGSRSLPGGWSLVSHHKSKATAIDAAEADMDEPDGMSQLKGLKLAFADSKTYVLTLGYFSITSASGFQNFFPTLVETLSYNRIITLLLAAPPYMFMVFYSVGHSLFSDRVQGRFWFYMYPIPITTVR